MSETHTPRILSPDNQRALNVLLQSITLSADEFTLLLPICNYGALQKRLIDQLQTQAPEGVQILALPQRVDSLYSLLQNAIAPGHPTALMIVGLDQVQDIDAVLAATNLVREEFRKHFRFPVWIWINDQVQQKLIRQAPDIESWATPIPFHSEPDLLQESLRQIVDRLYEQVRLGNDLTVAEETVNENLRLQQELEAAIADLHARQIDLDPELEANIAFARGQLALGAEGIDAIVRERYEQSLQLWDRSENSLHKGIVLLQLGRWWQGEALQRREDEDAAFQQAQTYLQNAIALFHAEQQSDLEAKCIRPLGEVLHRLNQWDELEKVAQQGLTLAQARLADFTPENHPGAYGRCCLQRAQGYRFLADVALARSEAEAAKTEAETALQVLAELVQTSDADTQETLDDSVQLILAYERSAAHFSLARAFLDLEQPEAGLAQLEIARQVGDPKYDPQLYIQILRRLWTLHFDQKDYLTAFEIKQQYRSIERQYGLRAFVGAGRLESQKAALRPGLATTQRVQVSQEIAASGRQQDVERLIERMGRPDCKLTVIYGQSGVGKSSLVQAGFIPAISTQVMDARRITVVLQQVYTNWVPSLRQCFQTALKSVNPHQDLPSLETADDIVTTLRQNSERDLLTILVFDQFEEFFFIYKDVLQRKPFYDFLQQCLNIPFVKVVLSLREDYLHYLLECNRLENLEIINNNILNKDILYYLGNFSKQDTKQVIESLTGQTAFYLQPDLVEALVDDLAGELGEVRPIELQVVGAQLQTEQIKTLALYQERGPKAALVGRFLEEVVKDCGPEQEQIAKLVLYLLTDENNTRPLKTRADLELELDVEEGKLDLVLKILVFSRLVFLIPATPADRYQLVHDYLVEFVRKEQSARLVQEIEKEREMRRLTEKRLIEVQKQELHAARRARNNLIGLVASIGCFALVSVIVGFNFYLTSLRLAADQKWGPNQLVDTLKVAKLLKRFSWLALPEIRRKTALSLAEAVINMGKPVNILEGHTGKVTGLAFHPQNDQIATSSRDKTVKLWDVNGKLLNTMDGHSDKVGAVTFNNQGSIIASGSKDSTVRLWALEGEEHQIISSHSSEITALDFSPDDKILASADKDGNIQLSKLSRSELYSPKKQFPAHVRTIVSLDISPDNQRLASVDMGGDLKIWDLEGELITNINLKDFPKIDLDNEKSWLKVAFSRTGNEITVLARFFGESSGYRLGDKQWFYDTQGNHIDLQTDYEILEFSSQILQFKSVKSQLLKRSYKFELTEVSKDDKFIAGLYKNDVRIASLEENYGSFLLDDFNWLKSINRTCQNDTQNYIFCFHEKGDYAWVSEVWNNQKLAKKITNLKIPKNFDAINNQIIFSDSISELELIQLAEGRQNILKNHNHSIHKVYFSPNAETAIAIDKNNSILLIKNNRLESIIPGQNNNLVKNILFNAKGDLFSVFGSETTSIWDNQGNRLFQVSQKKHEGDISTVIFSPDGGKIAFIYSEGLIDIFSRNGDFISRLKGYAYPKEYFYDFIKARFSSDGRLLIFSGGTNVLHLWNSSTDSLHLLKSHNQKITDFELSSDNTFLFSSDGEKIKIWNLVDYSLINEFETFHHLDDAYFGDLVFPGINNNIFLNPTSDILVSHLLNGQANIWRIPTNDSAIEFKPELIETLKNTSNFRFTPDGRSLAFTKEGTSVKLLDLDTKEEKKLQSHDSPIYDLIFSDDGKYLISISSRQASRINQLYVDGQLYTDNQLVIDKEYLQENYINQEDGSPKNHSIVKIWNLEIQKEESTLSTSEAFFAQKSNLIVTFDPVQERLRLSVRSVNGELVESHDFTQKDAVHFDSYTGSLLLNSNKEHYVQIVGLDGTVNQIGQHYDVINEVVIHPSNRLITSASDDQTIKIWKFDGQLIQNLEGHTKGVEKLVFSPNGELIASASGSQEVFVWNLQGELIHRLLGYQDEIQSLTFSPDSKRLAISDAQSLELLNLESKEKIEIIDQAVSNVLFSKNGKIIGALVDSNPRIWTLDGTLIKGYSSISGSRLSFSKDNQLLLLGRSIQSTGGIFSQDDSWKFWRLRNLYLDQDSNSLIGFSGNDLISINLDLNFLLERGCTLAKGFIVNNPNIKEQDRKLCDGILEEK